MSIDRQQRPSLIETSADPSARHGADERIALPVEQQKLYDYVIGVTAQIKRLGETLEAQLEEDDQQCDAADRATVDAARPERNRLVA